MKLIKELDETTTAIQQLKVIGRECSEFVQSPRELYRGSSAVESISKLTIRTDRKPLDSPPVASAVYNYSFERMHNVHDVRMKSAFATTKLIVARRYGTVNWIFPINGVETWASNKIRDSIGLIDEVHDYHTINIDHEECIEAAKHLGVPLYSGDVVKYLIENGEDETKDALERAVSSCNEAIQTYTKYTTSELVQAPADKELMLLGAGYYAINIEWVQNLFGVPYPDMAFELIVKHMKSQ